MGAVAARAVKVEPNHDWQAVRLLSAGSAAAIIAALAVGLLVGSRLAVQQAPAQHGMPSRDASIVQYRTQVDADMRVIDKSFVTGACDTRSHCLATLLQTRNAAEQLRIDLARMLPPKPVSSVADEVVAADTRFIAQLDAAYAVVMQPDSDYVSAGGIPDLAGLEIAVAKLDCWPAGAVEGDHGVACS